MQENAALLRAELPRPVLTEGDARAIFELLYGTAGAVSELGSQQDRNFRVETPGGAVVLKICHSDYAVAELEAQNEALLHLAKRLDDRIAVPVVHESKYGRRLETVEIRGQAFRVRLLGYLDGEPLTRHKHLTRETVAALGRTCANIARGLEDFHHSGLVRELQWDLRHAEKVARKLLSAVKKPRRRATISDAMSAASRALAPHAEGLRIQAIHHDITDDNVVARRDANAMLQPVGVIDFGDLMSGWLVADLAVTCASLLHHADGDPFFILPAVSAFHSVHPLTQAELKALWPLIVHRAGVLVASSEQQMAIDPDNDYVKANSEHEREIFKVANSVPIALMQEAICQAAGLENTFEPHRNWKKLLPTLDLKAMRPVRLNPRSALLDDGNWAGAAITEALIAQTAAKTGGSYTRYGEYRLTETAGLSPVEPATCALAVELQVPAGIRVSAPFAGTVVRNGRQVAVMSDECTVFVEGLETAAAHGDKIKPGAPFGVVDFAGRMTVQLCLDPTVGAPRFATPSRAAAWKALCPSPSHVLGFDCDAPVSDRAALLESRSTHFAGAQKHYYQSPPQFERGYRDQMYDTTARTYLDMVNNVTMVGHAHPRLAEAVRRQWSLLNTNSRFHYAGLAEFSERLAGLAPDGLDTVFLVNSGSEANDLALRLAWAHTGARKVLSLLEAYHGWTVASDAISTSVADNPAALETRPDWVVPITSPNTYRGPFRGENATGGYVDAVERTLVEIDRTGEGVAAFICECVYGNSGGIPLPESYLENVYRMIRERGGVTIADEVQVGYGRLGSHFWGFETQNVVPDIITIAKGMGNGHPLGAVITSRAIAESLEKEGSFFSSCGGSPVSCIVGMTVLDILQDEDLQANARDVGAHLKARLEALGEKHPLIGAVHGMGLYLGLEFVRDRDTLEPATAETTRICDRLLDLGVIMQPTGDHQNVLKIKPPLCLSQEGADYFVDMLDRTLSEGW